MALILYMYTVNLYINFQDISEEFKIIVICMYMYIQVRYTQHSSPLVRCETSWPHSQFWWAPPERIQKKWWRLLMFPLMFSQSPAPILLLHLLPHLLLLLPLLLPLQHHKSCTGQLWWIKFELNLADWQFGMKTIKLNSANLSNIVTDNCEQNYQY